MLFDLDTTTRNAAGLADHLASGPGLPPGYVYAGAEATETQQPAGCTTPVTRKLWSRGQAVPAEQYATWRAGQLDGGPDPLSAEQVAAESDARAFPRIG